MNYDAKDIQRVKDIIFKGGYSNATEKALRLSNTQANRITDLSKAIRRGNAAAHLNAPRIALIFYKRASVIGDIPLSMIQLM